MPLTYEEASQLTIGDEIVLDRNGQRFKVVGVPPHTGRRITLLLETDDGQQTFIDESRLHLISAGTSSKPPSGPAEALTAALHATVESATVDLTEPAPVEEDLLEEPELKKPADRKAPSRRKGK